MIMQFFPNLQFAKNQDGLMTFKSSRRIRKDVGGTRLVIYQSLFLRNS